MTENEEEVKIIKKIEKIHSSLTTEDAVAANAPTCVHSHQPDQQNHPIHQRHTFPRYIYAPNRSTLPGKTGHQSVSVNFAFLFPLLSSYFLSLSLCLSHFPSFFHGAL